MQIDLRRVHRRIWGVLTLLLAVGFLAALFLRPTPPVEDTPVPSFRSSMAAPTTIPAAEMRG